MGEHRSATSRRRTAARGNRRWRASASYARVLAFCLTLGVIATHGIGVAAQSLRGGASDSGAEAQQPASAVEQPPPPRPADGAVVMAPDDYYKAFKDQRLVVDCAADPGKPHMLFESVPLSSATRPFDERRLRKGFVDVMEIQFCGFPFHVEGHSRVLRVGGYLMGKGTIFVALVALSGPNDVPDSTDLSSTDVLWHQVVSLKKEARLVTADLAAELSPGWYAIVLGGEGFGARGSGSVASVPGVSGEARCLSAMTTPGYLEGWHAGLVRDPGYFFVQGERRQCGVLANDVAPRGSALTATVVRAPRAGSVTMEKHGTFTYVPKQGFLGRDEFVYEAVDDRGQRGEGTVNILVQPDAVDDAYHAEEDRTLAVPAAQGVLANDGDERFTAALVLPPAFGRLHLEPDGSFAYRPRRDFFGKDAFSYRAIRPGWAAAPGGATIKDSRLPLPAAASEWASGLGRVTIEVQGVNDPPVANDDRYAVRRGTRLRAGAGERPARNLYWIDPMTNSIWRCNTGGSQAEVVVRTKVSPQALALDAGRLTLYWSELVTPGGIYSCRTDGSEIRLAVRSPALDLAVDGMSEHIYWLSSVRRETVEMKVYRAKLDGQDVEDITPAGFEPANSIALDPYTRKLYWAEHGRGRIRRAMPHADTVENVVTGLREPRCLRINPISGEMCWVGKNARDEVSLFRAKTDGREVQEVLQTEARLPGWLAVDPVGGAVYWADGKYGNSLCVLTRGEVRADGLRGVNVGVSRAMALDYILPDEAACSVTANDEDADGDRLTAVVVAAPENGSLTLHADGSFEYVPSGQFVGTDRFVYKLSDGHDESRPATVTIDVGE